MAPNSHRDFWKKQQPLVVRIPLWDDLFFTGHQARELVAEWRLLPILKLSDFGLGQEMTHPGEAGRFTESTESLMKSQ